MLIVLSVCLPIALVMVLALCSCWSRRRQKDELQGLDGMVTQKNPDENVNHLPSVVHRQPDILVTTVGEDDYTRQRPVATSNTRRSLPDIPSEGQARGDGIWGPNGDNSSELYATVEPYHHNLAKRHTLPNGIDSRPSVSQHSSISQADDAFSPYASVNYDKLNKLEHPYAIVKPPNDAESSEVLEEPTVRTALLNPESAAASSEPSAPARSRRSSNQSGTASDINAATAVAGGVAASQELPYMTPPIGPVSQANFSGDSVDSSKGYTSISVREPLANIIAQTKEMNKAKRSLDPHYSTVSDDSDEMYTTIPDPNNQVYTSGSETYAQIQPVALTVAVEVNPVPSAALTSSTASENSELSDQIAAPQPPSVDSLKNMTNSHSRQAEQEIFVASSSSSVLNLGSPKPEKRQANSPLPPPPSATSPDFLLVEKAKNLDDMYAKVHKNRKKSEEESPPQLEEVVKVEEKRREHNYETLKKSPRKNSDPGYEKLRIKEDCEPGYASINGPDSLKYDDPNYEQLREPSLDIAGYSVVNKKAKGLKVKEESEADPNYESMQQDPNYESVHQNDPNYESVKYLDVEVDPPYEKLEESSSELCPGYEKIEKTNDYETIKSSTVEDEGDIFQV